MKSLETAEEMAKRLSNGSIVQLPFPDKQIDNSFCVKCEGCNVCKINFCFKWFLLLILLNTVFVYFQNLTTYETFLFY